VICALAAVFSTNYEIALGIIAIVVAAGFAYWHSKEINDVLNKIETQVDNLKTIEKSMSTRYIGEFPDFLPEISNLILEAREQVIIFCDIPAYAYFSNNSYYNDYEHNIETIRDEYENVKIELICLDKNSRNSFYEEFLEGKKWDSWRIKNKEKLKKLPALESKKYSFELLKKDQFIEILEEANQHMIERGAFSSATTKEIETLIPIFFWIVDEKKAIFSIPSYKSGHLEYGFFTSDSRIILSLLDMKQRYSH
jgi:hypothetical protein